MKEQLVSYETAMEAKERGFNWGSDYFYRRGHVPRTSRGFEYMSDSYVEEYDWNNGLGNYPTEPKDVLCSAPTQSLLQKWLREKHSLHIEVLLSEGRPYTDFYYRVMEVGKYFTLSHDGIYSESYEETLESGLLAALKLIKA